MIRGARLLALALCAVAGLAGARERVLIPVGGTPLRLEAFVYAPATAGPHPVIVYSHGSSAGQPRATLTARRQAEFFVARGFAVVVAMRRGRGASSGESMESEEKNCDPASWKPGIASAFEDLTAVIDHARTLAGRRPLLLAGASRGGYLSVAYAADGPRRDQVAGVINFSGGWVAQAQDQCPEDFNDSSFAAFGARARAPMLWVYGAQDPYYGAEAIPRYAAQFRAGGGQMTLVSLEGRGHDVAEHPSLWKDAADAFLARFAGANAGP